jgi:hypothetical protein
VVEPAVEDSGREGTGSLQRYCPTKWVSLDRAKGPESEEEAGGVEEDLLPGLRTGAGEGG